MSYGDTFVQAFSAGQELREKKKRRQQDDELAAAHRQLEIDMQAKQLSAQKQLQDDRMVNDAKMAFEDRNWRTNERTGTQGFQSGENVKDRSWRTDERMGTQGFQGSQAELDRAARQLQLDKELANRDKIAGAEQTFKNQTLDWEKDPANSKNVLNAAHARYLSGDDGGLGLPPLPGAKQSLQNGQPAPVSISTQDEFDKLPKGARFNFNGRIGIKN